MNPPIKDPIVIARQSAAEIKATRACQRKGGEDGQILHLDEGRKRCSEEFAQNPDRKDLRIGEGMIIERGTFRRADQMGEEESGPGEKLRLCWEVILTSHARGEMFRVLVDAQSGEVRVRHCLTQYISDATYSRSPVTAPRRSRRVKRRRSPPSHPR